MDDKKKTKKPAPRKAKAPASRVKKTKAPKKTARLFPIVGLGVSAGGLQALKRFFSHVPEKSGMAYIVLVHMTPKQPSIMPDLLQKVTAMPVETARDGQAIEADHVYVIPPDKEISVFRGKIQLMDVVERHSTLPIDAFLRSLAQDQGPRAVAVVLSGTGTDGTLGIKEIKANDGLVLGSSETIGSFSNLFDMLDKKWKIFRRVEIPQELRQQIEFPSGPSTTDMALANGKLVPAEEPKINLSLITQRAILEQFAPTALLVDARGTILHVQGRTGKYLETPSGPPTHNILDMARQGLRFELSSALRAAKASNQAVTHKQLVRNVFDMNEDPMAVLDAEGKIVLANASFARLINLPEEKIAGLDVFDINNGLLAATDLKSRLAEAAEKRRILPSPPRRSRRPTGPTNISSTGGSSASTMPSPTGSYCN